MLKLEESVQELQKRNTNFALELNRWKSEASRHEKEKIKAMKEVSELRSQLAILRSKSNCKSKNLASALQSACETALSHLVQGSNAITSIIETLKDYMQDIQEIHDSTRWSYKSEKRSTEKVHKVRPTMMDGVSIQPVVSLSRTSLPYNNSIPNGTTNGARRGPAMPIPIHMLQDVFIPLTRIDANDLTPPCNEVEENNTSTEDLDLEDNENDITPEEGNTDNKVTLETVEEENEEEVTSPSIEPDPLEGPSWLLDAPSVIVNGVRSPRVFTPTVRRRKRTSWTECSPILQPSGPKKGKKTKELKVLVAKMKLDNENGDATPPKNIAKISQEPQDSNDSSDELINTNHAEERKKSLIFNPTFRKFKAKRNQPEESDSSRESSPRRETESQKTRDKKLMEMPKSPYKRALHRLSLDKSSEVPVFDAPSPKGSTDVRVIVQEASQPSPEFVTSRVKKRSGSQTGHNSHTNHTLINQVADSEADHTSQSNNVHHTNRHGNINQTGHSQTGHSNEAGHSQTGHSNQAGHSQTGHSNQAGHSQTGHSNQAGHSQTSQSNQTSHNHTNQTNRSRVSSVSDTSSETDDQPNTRARRNRKNIVYKEVPLNRKLRR